MYGAIDAVTTEMSVSQEKESLRSIGSDLRTLRAHLDKLDTTSDSTALRESIRRLRSQLKRKISEEQVRQANLLDQLNENKSELGEDQKRDWHQLQSFVSQLYRLMEEEKSRLQQYPSPHPHTRGEEEDEVDWGGSLLRNLPLHGAAQTEGDAADLEEIQRDIADLLEIESNLNRLVHEQGHDINLIEANVGVADMRVTKGKRVLGEAAVLQGSSRQKKCCIVVCVLIGISIPLVISAILIPTLIHLLS